MLNSHFFQGIENFTVIAKIETFIVREHEPPIFPIHGYNLLRINTESLAVAIYNVI